MPLMANGVQVDITATNSASPVIKQVAADIGGLETSAKNAGDGVGSANAEMAGMGMTAEGLGIAIGIVTAGVTAMVAAFEFGEIAAGNDRLIASGQKLAAGYGESLDTIISKVREASLGTVSDMDIITSANKAMMLGVGGNAEQLANLMEIAAFKGRAMGISTSQAFDDMARGVGRMSPMILDNLGIIVDAKTTYGNYAESIGKSASELTRAEKIQALLNKVLTEGNAQLEANGGLVEDNASKYERWNAELENTKNFLLEDFLQMSRLADMGSDLLISFRDLADNGIGYASGELNPFSLFMEWGASRVALMNERVDSATTSYTAMAQAFSITAANAAEYASAEARVIEVDAEAVKGAMEVHDTYEKLGDKMSDLQLDHADLLAKKQELIDQGWWQESQKIQDVNEKLAENEQKQKDVTTAMQGTLTQMLLNTAAAGLDAEGQLALARATGQIDEATYAALTAQGLLKKQYEDGTLTADEYAKRTLELRNAVNSLQSKDITITVDAILNEIRNVYVRHEQVAFDGPLAGGYAEGTDGWKTVPPGYPNDSYPVMVQSGEQFAVIPAGGVASPISAGGFGGGGTAMYITYAPQMSFGNEQDSINNLESVFLSLLEKAKAGGHV